MMASSSEFLPASELPASPSREQELEELVKSQAAVIERISEMLDYSGQVGPGRAAPDSQTEKRLRALEARAAWSHEEKQALIEKLSDLSEAVKALDKSLVHENVEPVRADCAKALAAVEDIRSLTVLQFKTMSRRLTVLEDKSQSSTGSTVKSHLDYLYDHMKATDRKQVRVSDIAKILGISRQRVHQMKAAIAEDDRFIILKSESHKQRRLIRLRECYKT